MTVLSVVGAFALSAILTGWLAGPRAPFRLIDRPNARSLHEYPTPRGGGLGILGGIGGGLLIVSFSPGVPRPFWYAVAGAGFVALVSFVDDIRGLPPALRFITQGMAAAVVLLGGISVSVWPLPGVAWILPLELSAILSWLFIVWMTNLYNFMDGMDGFAGGMALIGFTVFGLLGWIGGNNTYAVLSLLIAASAGGFLLFNFPPARIFMGDVGSSTLGFLAAVMVLWAAKVDLFPYWVGVLVFSPFFVDATVTLVRRLLNGEKVWQAHRSHYYQRMVQAGWTHRRTVLWEYGLMLACGISAVFGVRLSVTGQWSLLLGWAALYVMLATAVGWMERRAKTA